MPEAASALNGGRRGSLPGGLLRSLRPHQWVKNVFLFAALFFSGRLFDPGALGQALLAFAIFCLLSSSVYLVNDILDRERDREHPIKRERPIASGLVPPLLAGLVALMLVAVGLTVAAAALGRWFFLLAVVYAASSYAYSLVLKHVVIVDVMVLALGYALRAISGAVAIGVDFSNWLLLCTSLVALFLGFCKRRQELVSLEEGAVAHRSVLAHYSEGFLDQMISVVTASTLISYLLYAFSPEVARQHGTPYLGLTVPFVMYGIFRYFYLVHICGEGGRPARELVADAPLAINVLLYGATVVVVLYVI